MDINDILDKLSLPRDFTRRGFLKAASAAAAVALMADAKAKTGERPYVILETAQGLIIADPNLCVACHRCELACTEFNEGKADPRLTRIRMTRNTMFGPNGINRMPPAYGAWGNGLVVQDTCRQCPHPVPCANACPQGAIQVDEETGARVVVKERCIGCHLCEKACPWDMMTFDVEENKASKCFLCHGDPKCVKACPAAAIRYVPWFDRSKEEDRRAPHGYLPNENAAQCSICHR
ncbi:4Fe-4S dicluster domain-containing protein [Sutterella sp.]|uniref:4Fe-4S dicluster domain-containing protein n=1 Tax=Sutterella sp. TaxID=1981025 RepID=UPI0026E08B6A|nr:4Fe-4S dicluster domain-containing protein [Sutterella sp.]MDO5530579.1 4Fe-4S dicluster domain-containing protein [Sutterella sp.]